MDHLLSGAALTRWHIFERDWEGQTVVVIGNGPSLLDIDPADIARVPARKVVANGGYKRFPWATALMCSDRHWLAANADLSGFKGAEIIVTQPDSVARRDYRMVFLRRAFIERRPNTDPFEDAGLLVEGHNSTSTNISMAVIRGAARIVLLGIDLAPGPNGRRRIYDESTEDLARAKVRYDKQVAHLKIQSTYVKKHGVEVLNASPRSALSCYPFVQWGDIEWPSK